MPVVLKHATWHAGGHSGPQSSAGLVRRLHHWTSAPTRMRRTLVQQCMRASWTTGTAKPVRLSSATQVSQSGRVLQRGGGGKSRFHLTSVLQPLLPGPPTLLCFWGPPTQGKFALFACELRRVQFHRPWQPEPWQNHHSGEQRPVSCPLQAVHRRTTEGLPQ